MLALQMADESVPFCVRQSPPKSRRYIADERNYFAPVAAELFDIPHQRTAGG